MCSLRFCIAFIKMFSDSSWFLNHLSNICVFASWALFWCVSFIYIWISSYLFFFFISLQSVHYLNIKNTLLGLFHHKLITRLWLLQLIVYCQRLPFSDKYCCHNWNCFCRKIKYINIWMISFLLNNWYAILYFRCRTAIQYFF